MSLAFISTIIRFLTESNTQKRISGKSILQDPDVLEHKCQAIKNCKLSDNTAMAIRWILTKSPGFAIFNCTGLFRHSEVIWSRSISLHCHVLHLTNIPELSTKEIFQYCPILDHPSMKYTFSKYVCAFCFKRFLLGAQKARKLSTFKLYIVHESLIHPVDFPYIFQRVQHLKCQ